MVVVYTYRNDGNDGLELRYSIRSMVKHFKAFTDLILVTMDPPSWFTGKVVEFEDFKDKPALSIMAKMIRAEVEDFLWCADDHFALVDFDESLPNYYNKHAKQVDTRIRKMQGNCPGDWLNYMVHAPMVINREKMLAACNWAAGREFPIKTLYVNFNKLPGEIAKDCKFRGHNSYENIKALIRKQKFFSTAESAMQPDMLKVLNELYPIPSPYEKSS